MKNFGYICTVTVAIAMAAMAVDVARAEEQSEPEQGGGSQAAVAECFTGLLLTVASMPPTFLVANQALSPADETPGPFLLAAAAGVVASTIGVKYTATNLSDEGSLTGALVGAALCPVLGILVLSTEPGGLTGDSDFLLGAGAILGALASPLGATIGYHMGNSHRGVQEQGLRHQVELLPPQVRWQRTLRGGGRWEVSLIRLRM